MWLVYGILAQAAVSVTVFIDKYILERHLRNYILVAIVTGIISFAIGFTLFTLRGFPMFPTSDTILLLLSGILMFLYLVPYMKALSLDDPSRVVPLFQFAPLFTLLITTLFLGQQLSGIHVIGFFMVIASGFLLSIEKDPKRIFRFRPAFWLMCASALLLALALIFFEQVVQVHSFWDSFAYTSIGIGLGTLLTIAHPSHTRIVLREIRALPIKLWGILGIAELFNFGYQLGYAYAVSLAGAMLVSLSEATQPAIVFGYGIVLTLFFPHIITEDIRRTILVRKVTALICMTLGFTFLYL